jgi:hypothetical protein
MVYGSKHIYEQNIDQSRLLHRGESNRLRAKSLSKFYGF